MNKLKRAFNGAAKQIRADVSNHVTAAAVSGVTGLAASVFLPISVPLFIGFATTYSVVQSGVVGARKGLDGGLF